MNLAEAPFQTPLIVTGYCEELAEHIDHFVALGLVPLARVTVLRTAPLGDPLQVKVGHSLLSIRKSEAAQLFVEKEAIDEA